MTYIVILFLIILSIYPLSYAKYNWDRKNKLGAIGTIILAMAAIAVPSILLLFR
ncbi:MAG TPA: hypothetical protein PLS45_09150 [Bacillota bacterium]|nr:hypothetical protein [Bacillota bacterium]